MAAPFSKKEASGLSGLLDTWGGEEEDSGKPDEASSTFEFGLSNVYAWLTSCSVPSRDSAQVGRRRENGSFKFLDDGDE